jgi:hypothetical protein
MARPITSQPRMCMRTGKRHEIPGVHLCVIGHGRCFVNYLRLGRSFLDGIPNARRFDDGAIFRVGNADG